MNIFFSKKEPLNEEKLQLLGKSIIISFFISVTLSCLIAFHLKEFIEPYNLYSWLALNLTILFIRLYSTLAYNNNSGKQYSANHRLIFFRAGSLLSGTIWGWCGYNFAAQVPLDSQLYISFMLAGLLAGASSSLSVDRMSFLSFILPTILPNIAHYLTSDENTSLGMASMLVLFTSFIIYAALIQGKNIRENMELRIQSIENEKKIQHLAFYDSLTELPNRTLCNDRIDQALCMENREHHLIGILFIDLDGFKDINDSFGHAIGDKLLQIIANRFKQTIRSSDTVSRIGGDEFIVILQKTDNINDIINISKKLLRETSKPVKISNFNLKISASIGIAIYPNHGTDRDTLIKNADNAMYLAKAKGKNNIQIHSH